MCCLFATHTTPTSWATSNALYTSAYLHNPHHPPTVAQTHTACVLCYACSLLRVPLHMF